MKVYIAGRISGGKPNEVFEYFDSTCSRLSGFGYEVLSPMLAKEDLRTEKRFMAHGYRTPTTTNNAILRRDHWMVLSSDIVFMNMSDMTDISIGCTAELAWAYDNNKHTVVILPEGNVMEHAFILQMADILFKTYEDAMQYMQYDVRDKV